LIAKASATVEDADVFLDTSAHTLSTTFYSLNFCSGKEINRFYPRMAAMYDMFLEKAYFTAISGV